MECHYKHNMKSTYKIYTQLMMEHCSRIPEFTVRKGASISPYVTSVERRVTAWAIKEYIDQHSTNGRYAGGEEQTISVVSISAMYV